MEKGLVLILTGECTTLSFNFFKNYWRTSVLLAGTLTPLSLTSGGVSCRFQSQCGQPCLPLHVTRSDLNFFSQILETENVLKTCLHNVERFLPKSVSN